MISISIKPAITALLAGVNAAYPLATATVTTLARLQQQAHNLTVLIDSSVSANESLIVSPAFVDPLGFASLITKLTAAAQEEATLVELAALAGRAGINLANAGV